MSASRRSLLAGILGAPAAVVVVSGAPAAAEAPTPEDDTIDGGTP
ncbi:hypothetical protein [Nocardioides flavescens]